MSLRFQSEVADLQSRGITFADFLPEEVERFVRAVDKCDNPFSEANAELVGIPITACEGVYFWKLTIGASVWLDQYAKKWWLDCGRNKAYFWAIVYALIHARDSRAFAELTDEETAYERIKADALALAVNEEELTEAVDYALNLTNTEPKATKKDRQVRKQTDWTEVVTRLESQSGIKSAEWVWGRSLDYTQRAYIDLSRFAKAMGGIKGQTNRMQDELDRALNNLARVKADIINRVEAERAKK